MVEKDLQTYRGMPSNVSVSFDFDMKYSVFYLLIILSFMCL